MIDLLTQNNAVYRDPLTLKERIYRLMRKIEQLTDSVQDQMLDDNKILDEIQLWTETQKNSLKEINGVRNKLE